MQYLTAFPADWKRVFSTKHARTSDHDVLGESLADIFFAGPDRVIATLVRMADYSRMRRRRGGDKTGAAEAAPETFS
ncbi:hypothetical protein ACIQUB_25225 [Rhizobium sp. NPDC090275]|uniref:hypothetical protein n=1 Tax=Rhizobium sp. NPDC090275 TaxID=3364498 RepID=UPI00383A7ACB